jgi:aspartyl-tRNA(Asn)/glutamyl-tRNA(Gln) amidotransferase subunit C
MAISEEEVEYIDRLARPQLSPEKIVKDQAELTSILDYVEQQKQVDTTGIDSTAHYTSDKKKTKENEMATSFPIDDTLAIAPAGVNNMFSVPKVIDN